MLPILSSLPFDASDVHLRVTPTGGDEVSVDIETQGVFPVELTQLVYRSLSNDWAAVTYPGALGMLRITHSRNPVPADVERPAYVIPTTPAAGMEFLRTHLNALTLQILTDFSPEFGVFRHKVHVIEEGLPTELKYRAVPMALKSEGLLGSTRLSLSAIKQKLADQSLLLLWKQLAPQLGNPPLKTTNEIRDWMNDPNNARPLQTITWLNLASSGLQQLPPEIGCLTGLKELNLKDNKLRTLPPQIQRLAALRKLDLSNNQLIGLPTEIWGLTSLRKLSLSNNQLTEIPPDIGRLSELDELNLSHNQLAAIPSELGLLRELIGLNLDNNQLTGLPPELGSLINLRELYLSNNELAVVPPQIGGLTELNRLNLNNNQLAAVPREIGALIELRRLNLSNNRLRALPAEIGRLTKLRELYLRTNQLSEIPPSIRALPVLRELDVQGNNLTSGPRFRVTYDTGFGNHIAVCGIGRGLSSWDQPVRLENVGPDQWVLPEERWLFGTSGERIMDRWDGPCTYKFVLIEPGQVHVGSRGDGDQVVVRGSQHGLFRTDRITWERGPNRTLDASEHRTEVPSFHT